MLLDKLQGGLYQVHIQDSCSAIDESPTATQCFSAVDQAKL